MKKFIRISFVAACILCFLVAHPSCSKKSDDVTCKTCRAYNLDGGIAKEQQVCGEQEETAFRNTYSGKEISCTQ